MATPEDVLVIGARLAVGGDNTERDLGLPLEDTVFFAGEAADLTTRNFVPQLCPH